MDFFSCFACCGKRQEERPSSVVPSDLAEMDSNVALKLFQDYEQRANLK